jgi:hypothetical protein
MMWPHAFHALLLLPLATAVGVHSHSPSQLAHELARVSVAESNAHHAASLLRASTPVAARDDPPRPEIATKFAASVLSTVTVGAASSSQVQAISQDEDQQRTAAQTFYKLPFAPLSFVGTPMEWANTTQLTQASFCGIVQNGQTLAAAYNISYSNKFAWVAGATYTGGVVHDGQPLQKWVLAVPGNSFTLLVTNASVPVVQTIIMNTSVLSNLTTTFTTFTPGAELPGVWTGFNATDFSHPEPCTAPHGAPAAPVVRPVFIFHPNSSFDVVQQDAYMYSPQRLYVFPTPSLCTPHRCSRTSATSAATCFSSAWTC